MKFHLAALSAAGLAVSVSASISKPRNTIPRSEDTTATSTGKQRFSLNQLQNEGFKGHDAPANFILAHAKYGGELPAQLKEAIQMNPALNSKFSALVQATDAGEMNGSVSNFPAPMADLEYVLPVQMGTPPQTIPMNLDTGSSDFWTVSTDTYQLQLSGQKLYDPSASNTSHRLPGQSWIVKYGDGAGASGIVYKDRVQIGNAHVDNQGIESAVQISFAISQDTFASGIMGMASSNANNVRPDRQLTFMDNIRYQLEKWLFTANLQRGRPGTYNFGYIDHSEFKGPIQYAAINPNSPLWEISVSGYQIGGDEYKPSIWNAIVDTGTTLLLAPQYIVDGYYAQIPGSGLDRRLGMIVMPCEAKLPDFVFGLGSYRGIIPGHYINYAQANETHCYGGIQTSAGVPFSVLGDIALKAQFVVFDYENLIVGFANKDTDPPPA